MRAQDPKRRMEEKGLRRGHAPGGVTSRFLSLCLSLSVWRVHVPYSEKPLKNKTKQKDLQIELPYDPTSIFIAALFTIAKIWNQLKCL